MMYIMKTFLSVYQLTTTPNT